MSDESGSPSTHVVGSYVHGGEGGIKAGGDITVSSNVPQTGATPEQRRLVQDVFDAARDRGLAADPDVQALLGEIASALDAEPVRPRTVRALLAELERHAGSAAAVLAAVQLALPAFG
jgi:hypothetical protein